MSPSITTWNRLEPRPRSASVAPGLAARLRDPMWLLARQWQIGEFRGEDAGAPAWAELATSTSSMTGWYPDGMPAARAPLAGNPLEDLVASEPFTADLTMRVELGQVFEDLLAGANLPAEVLRLLRNAYPLPALEPVALARIDGPLPTSRRAGKVTADLVAAFAKGGIALELGSRIAATAKRRWQVDDRQRDRHYLLTATDERARTIAVALVGAPELADDAEAVRFLGVCAGRALDGVAIHAAARRGLPLLPAGGLGHSAAAVAAAAAALVDWVGKVYASGAGPGAASTPTTWQPDRLEYRLSVSADAPAGGTVELAARPNRDGLFDWSTFDVASALAGGGTVTRVSSSIVPGHVRFRGMPNARYWDFESAPTAFGEIQPDRRDVAKLVLMDFMLVHGDDWFAIPVPQPVGSLCRVDLLVVHDVFGVQTLIERAEDVDRAAGIAERWTLFTTTVATSGDAADFLLLPPTAGSAAQPGVACEEVIFLRDEMANLVWAIEERIENGIGRAWPGHERDAARRPDPPAAPDGPTAAELRYLLETSVPEHWIPFVPVTIDAARGIYRLERSSMERDESGAPTPVLPAGRILNPALSPYRIFEEEVPREGRRVARVPVRTRWHDGTTHLWLARRTGPGTGPGTAGLRFDLAVPKGRLPDEAD